MIQSEYFPLVGGLNLVDPPITLPPGNLLYGDNYECGVRGGYRRIDGFERYDGNPRPSAATYWILDFDAGTAAISEGDIVTGVSGGSGEALIDAVIESGSYVGNDAAGYLVLTAVTGTFVDDDNLQVSAVTKCVANGTQQLRAADTDALDATYYNDATETARAKISAVTGSGNMRGVHVYNGDVYAFRDNSGATACVMYKATTSGWVAQDLGNTIDFTSGGTYEVVEGDTITGATSTETAIVKRIILTSGSWAGGDAAGRFILYSQSGAFQAENLDVGANANVATIAGNSTVQTLLPGGRFEFENYNFGGHDSTYRMYGCDGVNKAFEWDGATFVPISTGMVTDTPSHIATFKKHLFLSFSGGSAQHSSIGDPYTWSAITGAAELAIGEEIVDFQVLKGDSMAIMGRNQTYILYGTSVADWVLQLFSKDTGAVEWTVQDMGRLRFLDDIGLTELAAVQEYGNFNSNTFSQLIQPLIDSKRSLALSSCIVRHKNQYRIFFSDNSGVIATFNGPQLMGLTTIDLGIPVHVITSQEDGSGDEVIYFGSNDGYIYQMDKGTSFDSSVITAIAILPYYHFGSPTMKKRFRKIVPELDIEPSVQLQLQPDFSYGSPSIPAAQAIDVLGGGGSWNIDNWGDFLWSSQVVSTGELRISGVGVNMGLYLYSSSATEESHTLHGMTVHYTMRGLAR